MDGIFVLSECTTLIEQCCRQLVKRFEDKYDPQYCFNIAHLILSNSAVDALLSSAWCTGNVSSYLATDVDRVDWTQNDDTSSNSSSNNFMHAIMLLLSSPHSLTSSLSSSKLLLLVQITESLEKSKQITGSCEESIWQHTQLRHLKIIDHLTTHLNHIVLLEDIYGCISIIRAMSENDDPEWLDEPKHLRMRILSRLHSIGGQQEVNCTDTTFFNVQAPNPYLNSGDTQNLMNREWVIATQRLMSQIVYGMDNHRRSASSLSVLSNIIEQTISRVLKRNMKLGLKDLQIDQHYLSVSTKPTPGTISPTATRLLVRYIERLGLLEGVTETSLVKYFCSVSFVPNEISSHFDWFAAFIYLYFQCDDRKAAAFLKQFMTTPESYYLWYLRGSSRQSKGLHLSCIIAKCTDGLLQSNYETCFNLFKIRGISVGVLIHRWLQQFFLGYMNLIDIAMLFTIIVVFGIDYLVYFLTVLLKEIALVAMTDVMVEENTIDSWAQLLTSSLSFTLTGDVLNEMKLLEKRSRLKVMELLQNAFERDGNTIK